MKWTVFVCFFVCLNCGQPNDESSSTNKVSASTCRCLLTSGMITVLGFERKIKDSTRGCCCGWGSTTSSKEEEGGGSRENRVENHSSVHGNAQPRGFKSKQYISRHCRLPLLLHHICTGMYFTRDPTVMSMIVRFGGLSRSEGRTDRLSDKKGVQTSFFASSAPNIGGNSDLLSSPFTLEEVPESQSIGGRRMQTKASRRRSPGDVVAERERREMFLSLPSAPRFIIICSIIIIFKTENSRRCRLALALFL